MIEKVIRMDGNSEYDYAKTYIVLTGDKLYHDSYLKDAVTITALMEIDKEYVKYLRANGTCEEVVQLLNLIRPRFKGFDYDEDWNKLLNVNSKVKEAMKVCEITSEEQTDVGGIKGLKISNF